MLRALSAHGRAVSVFLDGEQSYRLSYAAAGELIAERTTASPAGRPGRLPGEADSIIDAADAEDPFAGQAAALLAAEHITGERLTEEWLLRGDLMRLLVEDPLPDDIVPERYRDHHVLDDPKVRAIMDAPTPDKVADIRYLMASAVVHGSHLLHPHVDEALDFLRGDDDAARRRDVRRPPARGDVTPRLRRPGGGISGGAVRSCAAGAGRRAAAGPRSAAPRSGRARAAG